MFTPSMAKRLLIAASFLVAASAIVAQALPEMRMTPAEIRASALDSNQIGSSGLPGVHTKVIFGDPSKVGFYTILLFVPPHTTIQAHSHRDDRVATVVSGDWHLGYGTHFESPAMVPPIRTISRRRTIPRRGKRIDHLPTARLFCRTHAPVLDCANGH